MILFRKRALTGDAAIRPGKIIDPGGTAVPYELMSPDRFLHVLQTMGDKVTPEVLEGIRKFRMEPRKMQAVFELIALGEEVPESSLSHLLTYDYQQAVGYDFWLDSKWFDDDTGYTATKLSLIALYGSYGRVYGGLTFPGNAFTQIFRLAESGQLDPARLNNLFTLMKNQEDAALAAFLAAHMDLQNQPVPDGGAYQYNTDFTKAGNRFYQDFTAEAASLRLSLFATRWLPAQIPATEYAELADISGQVLRELYPQVWVDGYAGYRAALAGQGATAPSAN